MHFIRGHRIDGIFNIGTSLARPDSQAVFGSRARARARVRMRVCGWGGLRLVDWSRARCAGAGEGVEIRELRQPVVWGLAHSSASLSE